MNLPPVLAVLYIYPHPKVKVKDIHVTGRGGPYGCETSRLPHFLKNQLTDGGEIVSLSVSG
jgi:hypothetical protein